MAERTFSPAAVNSDPGLESRLLASLNPDTLDEAQFANLNAAMFSSRECRALYEQMEQAAAKREAFPKVDGEPVGDVGDAARRVVELYQRRLMAVALDYLKDGLSENRDVTDVISRVETALAAARLAADWPRLHVGLADRDYDCPAEPWELYGDRTEDVGRPDRLLHGDAAPPDLDGADVLAVGHLQVVRHAVGCEAKALSPVAEIDRANNRGASIRSSQLVHPLSVCSEWHTVARCGTIRLIGQLAPRLPLLRRPRRWSNRELPPGVARVR